MPLFNTPFAKQSYPLTEYEARLMVQDMMAGDSNHQKFGTSWSTLIRECLDDLFATAVDPNSEQCVRYYEVRRSLCRYQQHSEQHTAFADPPSCCGHPVPAHDYPLPEGRKCLLCNCSGLRK